jgi:hypothetical protein
MQLPCYSLILCKNIFTRKCLYLQVRNDKPLIKTYINYYLYSRVTMKKLAQLFFKKNTEEHYVSAKGTNVKILFSSENPSLLGKTMETTAIEMSPRSIRLEVSAPIEINSVLDIVVKLDSSERSYNLTGNVRWRLPSTRGQYHIVLVLRERNDIRSDFRAWKSNFELNFEYAQAG